MENRKLSILTERVLPGYIRDNFPGFEYIVQKYFEYLEQEYAGYDLANNIITYRNIDKTTLEFIKLFKAEYGVYIPDNIDYESESSTLQSRLTYILKNIKSFYASKGTADSYSFLMKVLFDNDITYITPSHNVFRLSDSNSTLSTNIFLQDSNYWQDFSYEIASSSSPAGTVETIYNNLHPSGFKLFYRYTPNPELVSTSTVGVVDMTLTDSWGNIRYNRDYILSWSAPADSTLAQTMQATTIDANQFDYSISSSNSAYNGNRFFVDLQWDEYSYDYGNNYEMKWFCGGTLGTGVQHSTELDDFKLEQFEQMDGAQSILLFIDGHKQYIDNIEIFENNLRLVPCNSSVADATVPNNLGGKKICTYYLNQYGAVPARSFFNEQGVGSGTYTFTIQKIIAKNQILAFTNKKKLKQEYVSVAIAGSNSNITLNNLTENSITDIYILNAEADFIISDNILNHTLLYRLNSSYTYTSYADEDFMIFYNGLMLTPEIDYSFDKSTYNIIFKETLENGTLEIIKLKPTDIKRYKYIKEIELDENVIVEKFWEIGIKLSHNMLAHVECKII